MVPKNYGEKYKSVLDDVTQYKYGISFSCTFCATSAIGPKVETYTVLEILKRVSLPAVSI